MAATIAAPITTSTAGAQGGWGGFTTISVPSDLGAEGALNDSAGWGAGVTNDLGGVATDLWVNNHANRSEALIDFVGGSSVFNNLEAAEAGLADTHGVTFSDIDGDGDEDLIETMGGGDANRIRINANGTLGTPNDASALADADGRGRQAVMVDIDNDGDMDALVANLQNLATPSPSELYLNNGSGVFTKVTDTNNVLSDGNIRFAHVTTTGPGEPNIIVTSNLFSFGIDSIRTGENGLVAVTNPVTQTVGADDNATNMRDIALGDLDGDLIPEWVAARQDDFLLTDTEDNGNDEDTGDPLPPGDGDPDLLGDLAIGIGQVSVNGNDTIDNLVDVSSDLLADNCRAVSLADFDNDGDLDIFGGCTMAENSLTTNVAQTRNIVLLNNGAGSFSIAAESLVPATAAATATVVVNADFNNDGWIDTYVGGGHDNAAATPPIAGLAEDHIFLNDGGTNNWLKIDLVGSNPDAVGTQVFVGTDKWQVRESGHRVHGGQDMKTLHFGLGTQSELAPLEIMWPDGTFERCQAAGINQTVTITQGGDNCQEQTKSGMLANLAAAPDTSPLVAPLMCNDLLVTVDMSKGEMPTEGDDVIRGTAGADTINALGGNDTICALQGDDVIDAGDGFDKVFAGAGADTINGGVGNDLLIGGLGNDTINGGNGNDRIQGGPGVDELNGENGKDRISGGDGNDIIRGGKFDDTLFGNLGRDEMFGDEGNDVLRGGAWKDTMNGGAGNNDGCTLTDPGGLTETRVNCESGVFGR